jgi:hypothetical protein
VPWLVIVFFDAAGATAVRTIARPTGRNYDEMVRAHALVEVGDQKAVDVFLRREDAFAGLEDVLGDEPDWSGLLYVAPIELDERNVSAN